MKQTLALAISGIVLASLLGCVGEKTSISSGSFHVDSNTGLAIGEALGIEFEVANATGVHTVSQLSAGKPEHTSAQLEIKLAEDLTIRLEMLEAGGPVSLEVNDVEITTLNAGDRVVIDEDRNVTVNGTLQGELKAP